ncbi:MAG: hypothetical protein LBC02_03835 [Planctomycetaceae bacterium]|jgi:hypothetical protein|nr:hypothetical protein [Planctomycetaceae bacterium]
MKHLPIIFFVVLTTIFSFTACSHKTTPPDLPKLYPCEITVIQDGKPLADVNVVLQATDKTVKYGYSSVSTAANGIAVMRTYGETGVPAGVYKIILQKSVTEGEKESADVSGMKYKHGGTTFTLIDAKFTDVETTPLEIEIKNGKNIQTIDVGNAVKIKQAESILIP